MVSVRIVEQFILCHHFSIVWLPAGIKLPVWAIFSTYFSLSSPFHPLLPIVSLISFTSDIHLRARFSINILFTELIFELMSAIWSVEMRQYSLFNESACICAIVQYKYVGQEEDTGPLSASVCLQLCLFMSLVTIQCQFVFVCRWMSMSHSINA